MNKSLKVEVPRQLHSRLKVAAAARGVTMRELVIRWATAWLAKTGGQSANGDGAANGRGAANGGGHGRLKFPSDPRISRTTNTKVKGE